ncbi:hypothetical protein JKF63_05090 [Porcisia hertigi]|uniref:Uncharacterized protein n=1 Tax=Porcisia hertigi TaxID=2761500 RepID=A0A836I5X8_9TRYP|nr:hypothetical protein JKF63_05090 [Porcisia hertigi]
MLREARRRKQVVADKIGHEEYIYRLNGDPFTHQEAIRERQQGNFDPRQLPAAGARVVRVAGARGAAGPSRPPFAVDNDTDYNGGGGARHGRGALLAPVIPAPAAGPSFNNGPGLNAPLPGGYNGGAPPGVNYTSPFGGGMGGRPYPLVSHAQPVAAALSPVLPALAPVSDLPPPLPAVYKPKPPLTFHNIPVVGAGAPPLSFSPLPEHPTPGRVHCPSGDAGTPRFTAALAYAAPMNKGEARPMTSPQVLPALNNGGTPAVGALPTHASRPNTSGGALGGGGGGGFIIGSDGLSAAEERHREKMAARQRAIELQQENARQMLEQQLRKKAERELEIQEDRLAEQRLRREREEVARREQAEVDREKRDMELRMMGPVAAQAILEQKQRETQERREAEAAARRNRGKSSPASAAEPTPEEKPVPSMASLPPTSDNVAPTSSPSQSPAGGMFPLASRPSLPPTASASAFHYLMDSKLGGRLCPLPQPSLTLFNQPLANVCSRAAPLPNLETQSIRRELQRITTLLEEQNLQQQRARDSSILGANVAPHPFHGGAPLPTTASGAGTYLTTGGLSPFFSAGGSAPLGSAQGNNTGPYRPCPTGGTLPLPPLSTAAPLAPSSPGACALSEGGIRPWQGLFAPYAGPPATAAGDSALSAPPGSVLQFTSPITENDVELPTEPSQFIGPMKAPVAAMPSPSVTLEEEVTFVRPRPTSTSSSSAFSADVTKANSSHRAVSPPPPSPPSPSPPSSAAAAAAAAMATSTHLSEAASPLGSLSALFSTPGVDSLESSPSGKGPLSDGHRSPSVPVELMTEAEDEEETEGRGGAPMMSAVGDRSDGSQDDDYHDSFTDSIECDVEA